MRSGDRIINEHDESEEQDLQEELYLVQRGRATFELDGERVDAPAGTLVFARPDVKRTAFAEERGDDDRRARRRPGEGVRALGLARSGCRSTTSTSRASTPRLPTSGRELIEAHPEYAGAALQPRVLREPRRADGRRDRAPPARDRAATSRSGSMAAEDSDFDPIRDEPAFKELVSGGVAEPATS